MVLSGGVVFLTTHLTSLQFLLMNDLNFANLWVLGVSSSSCLAHHQKQQQSKEFLQQSKSSKSSFSNQRAQFFQQSKSIPPASKERIPPPSPPLPQNRIAEAVHQWVWLLRMRSSRTCNVQFCLQEYRIINQSIRQAIMILSHSEKL
jgi:hypothetical protein